MGFNSAFKGLIDNAGIRGTHSNRETVVTTVTIKEMVTLKVRQKYKSVFMQRVCLFFFCQI
jgi:hypothetical protein